MKGEGNMKRALCILLLIAMCVLMVGCGGGSSYRSSSSSKKGAGGYDMPNSGDKSFSDYVKRVDPDLYNSMESRYNSLK